MVVMLVVVEYWWVVVHRADGRRAVMFVDVDFDGRDIGVR
jgi:hypothetical protein